MAAFEEDLEPVMDVVAGYLVEIVDGCTCAGSDVGYGHEPYCGTDCLVNLDGMDVVERIAVILDMTAALGTPEVLYRRLLGESMEEAGVRLKSEVMRKAENIWRVVQSSLPE